MYTRHSRKWSQNRYVYPVISRRSGGLSIGINLNPDKICNFGCIYCQVERSRDDTQPEPVNLAMMQAELTQLLQQAVSGELWEDAFFADVPAEKRVLRDIAFSGDAEPTSSPSFLEVVRMAVMLKSYLRLHDVKLVLITNAALLLRDTVQAALELMDRENSEVWAKLDAGTESYYRQINQAVIPFDRILNNILQAGQKRTIVIQTMVAQVGGVPFPEAEQQAYIQRLASLIEQGCRIDRVQLYTVARDPGESNLPENCDVQAVPRPWLEAFASRIIGQLSGLQVGIY